MFRVEDDVIEITRGDHRTLEVMIYDNQNELYEMQEGDLLTLTVRELPEDASPVLVQVHSITNIIVFDSSDTTNVEPGQYSADIELVTADGKPFTVFSHVPENKRDKGKIKNWKNFIILPEVTRHG